MPPPRFFVPSISFSTERIELPADEASHATQVLRLRRGTKVRVFDGAGRECFGRVASIERGRVELDQLMPVEPVPEPPVRVTLAVGLLKGPQMDAVVRDATALGVTDLQPMLTAHVAVPVAARDSRRVHARWRRVAVSAAKQCGRAVVPGISSPMAFDDVLSAAGPRPLLMCVEPGMVPKMPARDRGSFDPTPPSEALVLVGPEGGWSAAEMDAALVRGARFVALGPRTLRAELVPTVVMATLWSRWGW